MDVAGSQRGWREQRRYLNDNRWPLSLAAAERYPAAWRVAGTPLLARPGWLPEVPVPLEAIRLGWSPAPPAAALTGGEPESAQVRPLAADGRRYPRYADAVGALSRPALFEDRACYRLLDLGWPPAAGAGLAFGPGTYFDVLNISEAVAHELAAARLAGAGRGGQGGLPFRELVGDPFDPARRPVLPAISTLTLRRPTGGGAGPPSMVLHWRDPGRVASGGGLYQVMPVGMFQPSVRPRPGEPADLDLWHAMAREFSEEFLAVPEHLGSDGEPFDYAGWPFLAALDEARGEGRLRLYCLGAGIDPLTLVTDLLTVAVFDHDLFDTTFAAMAGHNAEGRVLAGARGLPFTAETVTRFTTAEPMQPAGAATLALAWRYRHLLR